MQQHGGGGGGGGAAQQFGVQPPREVPSIPPAGGAGQRISLAEAPSPISSRPPAQQFDDLGAGVAAGGFDAEALAVGEEGASGGAAGNRWPRQETLALLKIRSDMDAAFRDSTLKGPLWEEVSRKLAGEGYRRSAKKCKEKFENMHKYYKRTKESRAGRNDGKTYRFFTQLEALHGTGAAEATAATAAAAPVASLAPPSTAALGVSGMAGPSAVRAPAEPPPVGPTAMAGVASAGMPPVVVNMNFSTSNTEECSDDEDSDDEDTEEVGCADERGKRKRLSESGTAAAGGGVGSGKMMRFFEGLMKQVMERQEAMQLRFLEAIEKREQDRMIREEAWRRQEMARLAREQEILAQERAMAASRDTAVVSFIQKITGQTIPMPSIAAPAITVMPPSSQPHPTPIASAAPAPPPSSQPPASHSQTPQPQPSPQPQQKSQMPATPQPPQAPPPQQQQQISMDIIMTPVAAEPHNAAGGSGYDGSGGGGPSSSRWPKAEVHALIQLRSNMDTRYQEAGPKGPFWEEISAGMQRLGYNRSAKRCKEKWENINKYFKKVKESNKKRPEDSKTCPYFHQLDALYRNKAALNSNSGGGAANPPPAEHANAAPQERSEAVTAATPISQTAPQPLQHVTKNGGTSNNAGNGGRSVGGASDGGGGSGGMQIQSTNGSVAVGRFFGEGGGGGGGTAAKKPEDIMKEMMEQRQPQPQPQPQPQVQQQQQQQEAINSYNRVDGGADSDNMDDDDEDDDDDDYDDDDVDGNKMQYEIQFQRQQQHQQHHNVVRPNAAASSGGGNPPSTAAPGTAAAATTTAGSFFAMVQ